LISAGFTLLSLCLFLTGLAEGTDPEEHLMHTSIKKIRLFVLLILILHGQAWAGLSVSQIAENYGPAVVAITAFNKEGLPLSYGSGFFLNREGDLVTNHHVLSGCDRAAVMSQEGTEGTILFISRADPRLDLVVAKTSFKDTTPLTLGNSDGLSVGERIICMGNPPKLLGALSLGEVSHLRKMGRFELIQMTAPVLPGCSGGPVFNARGEVVGISMAFLDFDPNLNFALPVNDLAALKPVHLELSRLPEMTARLEAVVHEKRIVEVWMGENAPRVPAASKTSEAALHGHPAFQSGPRTNLAPGSPEGHGPAPGTVYFKSGKTLRCDKAWKQGTTIYLLMQGKRFVLGYEQNSIDMKKSFDPPL